MSIEVTAISKSYGTQKALDNISFSVKKGEIVGFLGPNGAGKSTLLSVLAARIFPSKGHATLLDQQIGSVDLSELRTRIGLASPSLVVPMSFCWTNPWRA